MPETFYLKVAMTLDKTFEDGREPTIDDAMEIIEAALLYSQLNGQHIDEVSLSKFEVTP